MQKDLFEEIKKVIIENGDEFEEVTENEKIVTKDERPSIDKLAGAIMYRGNTTLEYSIDSWDDNEKPCDEIITITYEKPKTFTSGANPDELLADLLVDNTSIIKMQKVNGEVKVETHGFDK